MAFDEKKIKLNSNGDALRDFIWMGDVCYILRKLLQYHDELMGKTIKIIKLLERKKLKRLKKWLSLVIFF